LITGSEFAHVFDELKRQWQVNKVNPLKEFKPIATPANMEAIFSIVPQASHIDDYQDFINAISCKL
jgi:hypothetical protein